jgi:hypothetical protein
LLRFRALIAYAKTLCTNKAGRQPLGSGDCAPACSHLLVALRQQLPTSCPTLQQPPACLGRAAARCAPAGPEVGVQAHHRGGAPRGFDLVVSQVDGVKGVGRARLQYKVCTGCAIAELLALWREAASCPLGNQLGRRFWLGELSCTADPDASLLPNNERWHGTGDARRKHCQLAPSGLNPPTSRS